MTAELLHPNQSRREDAVGGAGRRELWRGVLCRTPPHPTHLHPSQILPDPPGSQRVRCSLVWSTQISAWAHGRVEEWRVHQEGQIENEWLAADLLY